MIICPYCACNNKEGMLYCEECGRPLNSSEPNATLPTRQLNSSSDNATVHATWGTARFDANAQIVMHVRDSTETIVLKPDQTTLVGRYDSSSTQRPDVDLTPYGALEKGVSRVHAAIYRNEETDTLTLVDMGSANGTHLNGQRLLPDQPRVLRDGDEIRLGKMVTHIYFKT
ncbi:MAG: FHA domain-containing protein [Chloroflexi bacterium OLB15]|nr:MAG: FHA domain-containing protein [Chloroflexi bacterium OLB15]